VITTVLAALLWHSQPTSRACACSGCQLGAVAASHSLSAVFCGMHWAPEWAPEWRPEFRHWVLAPQLVILHWPGHITQLFQGYWWSSRCC